MELLKANYDDERITFSARELHEFLELSTEFRKWFPRMCEYGFEEGVDFQRVSQKCPTPGGVQEVVDYQITIDMAKEIAMIQRNEKGKQARRYFLEIEKRWNSPEHIMSRALQISEKRNKILEQEKQELLPLAEYARAIGKVDGLMMIGDLAALLTQNGYSIGRLELFEWLRNHGYLIRQKNSRNVPTRRSMKMGLFRVFEEIYYEGAEARMSLEVQVTEKGVKYFVKKFTGKTDYEK
ncbi:antA/AntB antirepressor family protein [Holdemania massiliensis]|uniref:antA/AntB antirepressor family protein n=1 Tax=Holdemania massiliensis TaxID=1468449 RepID=UPI001F068454|nr:antA/AntB antirepressor family protein [Holdemania massiliensis]